MSISSLVLELWQFSFIRDWPKIRKLELTLSEFCPISENCGKSGIPNLVQVSLIKCYCYWMLQNSRVTAFTVFELITENQQGGKITPPLPTPPNTTPQPPAPRPPTHTHTQTQSRVHKVNFSLIWWKNLLIVKWQTICTLKSISCRTFKKKGK